jgi:hypothetical protein
MSQDLPTNDEGEMVICVSCLTQNTQAAAFCRKCGSPIGAVATLDPMQTIQAEGFLFRKALEGRPRPIVVLGVWILFFPMLALSVGFAIHLIFNPSGFSDFVFFWAFVGLAYAAFVILYRVTRNYLTIPVEDES